MGKKHRSFWEENFPEEKAKLDKLKREREKQKQDYYDAHHPDLDAMTRDELETLREQLKIEIAHQERSLEGLRSISQMVDHPLLKALAGGLPDSYVARKEILDKQKLIAAIDIKLKEPLSLPPAPTPPPPLDPDEEILNAMKAVKEWEANLLAKESDPEIRKEIQLAARKKLDKLREKL